MMMAINTKTKIKALLEEGQNNSMSYQDYRLLMAELVATQSTTGLDKSEAMVNYTVLNQQRMKRWDKTVKVPIEAQQKIADFKGDVTWLVLTESWCGDAAHVIPVISKIAELNPNIDLRLVLRDENDALMSQFLTNGGKSIPKLIMIDNTSGVVLNTFGPRPSIATGLVQDYKIKHGQLTPEFKETLQLWYNKDKGQNTIVDLLALLGLD